MVTGVDKIKAGKNDKQRNNFVRQECIIVKQGNTLTSLAKEFGMSVSEFKQWAGLDKNTLNIGQKIELPVAKAKDGKGIYAIAREYGMTMAEFAKLNKIQDPSKYQAKKDEVFYVKPKQTSSQPGTPKAETKPEPAPAPQPKPTPKKQNTQPEPKAEPQEFNPESATGVASGAIVGNQVSVVIERQRQWGSSFTPEELSSNIYELADKYWGAVGKPDFDALINEINSKNASAVIDAFTKNENNKDKESLLFTVLREVNSKPEARKAAALKIYDALAAEKKAPAAKREEFVKELDAQFDSWGLINTGKLDSIIKEIMGENTQVQNDEVSEASKSSSKPAVKPSRSSKPVTSKDFKVEKLPKAGYWTVGATEERSVRVLFGKPVAVTSNGTVVSETIKFEPYQNNTGELKGKVIMVNAGHGMKRQSTPQLDMGKPDAKDENGKQIEEWRKNRDYADILIQNLRKKGATVIFTNGDAVNACNEKRKHKCDLFISLHCNATANRKKSGVEIFYHEGATKSKDLADRTGKIFGLQQSDIKSDITTRFKKLGVLTNIGPKNCPSILMELGYLTNPTDMRNIDSISDRQKKMDKLTQAIVQNKDKF